MPHEQITLNVLDYTPGRQGDAKLIPDVSVSLTITEVKALVADALKSIPAESILLYMGTVQMDDERKLKEFNKSNRTRVSIYAYEKKEVVVHVKTLQHMGIGGCVCVPIWALFMRQTMKIVMYDHETVGELRNRIAAKINDPDMYSPKDLKLTYRREMLQDDAVMLKDINIGDEAQLTLLVHCCFSTISGNEQSQGEQLEQSEQRSSQAEELGEAANDGGAENEAKEKEASEPVGGAAEQPPKEAEKQSSKVAGDDE